jgi:hypothetical protein
MTITKKKTSPATNQMRLFDLITDQIEGPTAAFNIFATASEFRAAMTEDIKRALDERGRPMTRYDVAAKMSNMLNKEITKSMIDNWTAPSHSSHNIDLDELVAFAMVTGGHRAVNARFRPAGLFALPSTDALRAQYQRLDEEEKGIKRDKRLHKELIRRIEKGTRI